MLWTPATSLFLSLCVLCSVCLYVCRYVCMYYTTRRAKCPRLCPLLWCFHIPGVLLTAPESIIADGVIAESLPNMFLLYLVNLRTLGIFYITFDCVRCTGQTRHHSKAFTMHFIVNAQNSARRVFALLAILVKYPGGCFSPPVLVLRWCVRETATVNFQSNHRSEKGTVRWIAWLKIKHAFNPPRRCPQRLLTDPSPCRMPPCRPPEQAPNAHVSASRQPCRALPRSRYPPTPSTPDRISSKGSTAPSQASWHRTGQTASSPRLPRPQACQNVPSIP